MSAVALVSLLSPPCKAQLAARTLSLFGGGVAKEGRQEAEGLKCDRGKFSEINFLISKRGN
jgi:hypothetical protein